MVRTPNISTKPPEIDAEKKLSVTSIVEYLDKRLPQFPTAFKKRVLIKPIIAETKITRELCLFLSNLGAEDVSLFYFYPEWEYDNDNSRRSSDLGVIEVKTYDDSKPAETFFVIEAKRLPPPRKTRKKEYVEGNLGGIQRYKMGYHGRDLSDSAIIGYIQDKNDCDYWSKLINEWITELIKSTTSTDISWDADDLLIYVEDFVSLKRYGSKNSRKIGSVIDAIKLHHYLMRLN